MFPHGANVPDVTRIIVAGIREDQTAVGVDATLAPSRLGATTQEER